MKRNELLRILDANLNRSREGLRVCEEITRLWMGDEKLTGDLRRSRHAVNALLKKLPVSMSDLMGSRDVSGDVGQKSSSLEKGRPDALALFVANMERAKEALRVLEETSQWIDRGLAARFKKVRFGAYAIEKRALPKLEALRHHRRSGR